MATISEEFSRDQNSKNIPTKTPLVESTGTDDGFKEFCAGIGLKYPDFVDASRPMRTAEKKICKKNGIEDIREIKIGYDGIVFGNFAKNKRTLLTEEHIFLALAEKVYDKKTKKMVINPYETWNQIDHLLPKRKILIYGPPLTSGTREVFSDLLFEDICFRKKEFLKAYPNYAERKKQCHTFRKDGKFIETGENDHILIENLKSHPDAFGIFGFNFLIHHKKTIQAAAINGVLPNHKTIASKDYKLSRPLFIYFKKEHMKLSPGMGSFIAEIVDDETIGEDGYLLNSGLVPLSDAELWEIRLDILAP